MSSSDAADTTRKKSNYSIKRAWHGKSIIQHNDSQRFPFDFLFSARRVGSCLIKYIFSFREQWVQLFLWNRDIFITNKHLFISFYLKFEFNKWNWVSVTMSRVKRWFYLYRLINVSKMKFKLWQISIKNKQKNPRQRFFPTFFILKF